MNTARTPFVPSTATIHDYNMVTPTLARITASIDPEAKKDQICRDVNAALGGSGEVVPGSFRMLDKTTRVGFVAASREVRPVTTAGELGKGYKILANNMYLANEDKSLWELKTGVAGKYLARNGADQLEALIQASRVSPTGSIPRLSRVVSAAASPHEIVAFIKQTSTATDLDYGFCVANKGGTLTVATNAGVETVKVDTVVASYVVEGAKKTIKSDTFTQPVMNMKDYYKRAYGGPMGTKGDAAQEAYIEKILQQIDEMAFV
jgi:hypothetical protein